MSIVTLRPNGAAVAFPYATGEITGEVAPTVVGGAPQLGDSSDATYAVSVHTESGPTNSVIGVQFPATTISNLTAATLYVREKSTNTSGTAMPRWLWGLYDAADAPWTSTLGDPHGPFRGQIEFYNSVQTPEYPGGSEGSIVEWAIPLVPSYDNLAGPLAAGMWLSLAAGSGGFGETPFDATLTVYDVWLVLEGTVFPRLRHLNIAPDRRGENWRGTSLRRISSYQ